MASAPIPNTSARRGKRRKVRFGCRRCAREHRAFFQGVRDGLRRAPMNRRFYCDGRIDW